MYYLYKYVCKNLLVIMLNNKKETNVLLKLIIFKGQLLSFKQGELLFLIELYQKNVGHRWHIGLPLLYDS